MHKSRALIARITLLAWLVTALSPFFVSFSAAANEGKVPICTMSGIVYMLLDEYGLPTGDTEPASAQKCPLCSFYGKYDTHTAPNAPILHISIHIAPISYDISREAPANLLFYDQFSARAPPKHS